MDSDGRVLSSTVDASELAWLPENTPSTQAEFPLMEIDDTAYYALRFRRRGAASQIDQVSGIVVLFDKDQIDADAKRAALFPLLTGLSTVGLVSISMFFISARFIRRLQQLEQQVQRVAEGDFETALMDESKDEVGRLGTSINSMASQLQQLWRHVNREQGAKLLHQIAAGMAHQLRNTLTGARMAMELHQQNCQAERTDEVSVAIRQLEIAEDYVNRLLSLGATPQQADHPQSVLDCLADVRSTHESIAKHLNVHLDWSIETLTNDDCVKDGPSYSAAVSNLVLNAMQSGDHVSVRARTNQKNECVLTVIDNGSGVDATVSEDLFEPFVTSKPEGMGLGLSLVHRTAEYLGGRVDWHRETEVTVFELVCPTIQRNGT
jgi:signal transduction histidine kinase